MNKIVVIGAGLTGLTTAYRLKRLGYKPLLLEKKNRVGGQIASHNIDGFIHESGPNTGIISCSEIVELFSELEKEYSCDFKVDIARAAAKKRLIWKKDRFHELPSSLLGGITTPLFTPWDKVRILAEPFIPAGSDKDESIGSLVRRRLGKSYLKYAVDPFIGGIYAGDPERLTTRFALPKLYNLEQSYGSFVRGAIKMGGQQSSNVTKETFSCKNGLQSLTDTLARYIGNENIILNVNHLEIEQSSHGEWSIKYKNNHIDCKLNCNNIVSTVPAYELPLLFGKLNNQLVSTASNLDYVPMVQVSIGINKIGVKHHYDSFGGLIPSCENRKFLGILYPSSCFEERTSDDNLMMSIFIGGRRFPEVFDMNDDQIRTMVLDELDQMLGLINKPKYIAIYRHKKAIPQYESNSASRLEAISQLEKRYRGLYIGGNIKDGIGMADRVKQAFRIANEIDNNNTNL